jgi:hypothetical protein
MFRSVGTIDYSVVNGYHRMVVLVDPELHRFFRSLVPPHNVCRPQRYPPHITVVRGEIPETDAWGKYQGTSVKFYYENFLHHDGVYWWFNCYSTFLTDVRLELGLPRSYHLTRPPNGAECFHSTIGNSKR